MTFNTIVPGAWELTQNLQYEIFSLQVSSSYQQVAKSLATQRSKAGYSKYPSVPVSSFDPIIAASFPQVIKTERGGWQRPGVPWLFATEKVDLDYLPELIKDWLREEFCWCLGEEKVDSLLDQLNHDDWKWDDKPITNPVWNLPKIEHKIDFRFPVIPDYLAIEFVKNSHPVCFGENNQYKLQFYRVVRLGKGSELMSWPPYPVPLIEKNQHLGTANISFVINFKLQTVPWRKEPIIYHELSIRRWLTQPLERIPYRGATAYIGDNRRWLDGTRQPFCFIPLQIKRRGTEVKWSRAIRELLTINDSPLPDPDNLALTPAYNWSEINQNFRGIQVAIAYDTRHRGEAPCLAGVSPRDLASLDGSIQERLSIIQRIGEAIRIEEKQREFWELRGNPKTPILRSEIATHATFRIVDNPNTILILWETRECKDALIAAICELLSLSQVRENKIYKTNNGLQGEVTIYCNEFASICIKTQHVQGLTQRFDIPPSTKVKDRPGKRNQFMDERIKQIQSSLPKPEGLSGALIEIRPKKSFFPAESDPKLALRIGVMQAGYVNQHLHALTGRKKSDTNRILRAVSDLLRQFGVLPSQLIDIQKDDIDPHIWLTCFYVLRRTKKTTANNKATTGALMVRVNPVTGIVQVTTHSLFPTWLSYPAALEYLLSEKWDTEPYIAPDIDDEEKSSDRQLEQQFFNDFVTKCLRDCLSTPIEEERNPRVLFMAEAQNARRILTWLQNPNLPNNDLPNELKRNMTESEISRLWVVRLRVAENGEVPVAIVKGSPGSRSNIGGVFIWQNVCDDAKNTLYLSLRKLLNTEQDILRKFQSRFDNGSRQAGNPRLLEIAVVHHPGIERNKLAYFVHNLRRRWPYFADDVSLPFPFPFATLAKEYAVSAKDAVEPEDSQELEDLG